MPQSPLSHEPLSPQSTHALPPLAPLSPALPERPTSALAALAVCFGIAPDERGQVARYTVALEREYARVVAELAAAREGR